MIYRQIPFTLPNNSRLKLRRLERFVYEYNFGDSWIHDLRMEAVLAANDRKRYPVCVARKRAAPPEDCGGMCAFMENRWQYDLIGSGESREELDGFIDDVEDEEWDRLSGYHPERFARARVNRALVKLASGSYGEALHEIHHPSSD